MAFAAEVPRVTGGAGCGYLIAPAFHAGELAVQLKGKTRALVRRRLRKLGHILPGQERGAWQWQVTGSTAGVGCRQVSGSNLVTVETALYHRQAHAHPLAPLGVARLASQHGVHTGRTAHGFRVLVMSEAEIAAGRARWWPPFNLLFNASIVAIGTTGDSRPQRSVVFREPGVAAGTARKELAVLPMIEAVLRLGRPWRAQ
jgi:hypothetical protein